MYFFYFYPLGLDCRRRRTPWLSWTLMALMLVAFLWVRYFPRLLPFEPWELVFFPGNGSPWTALTAIWLHGGWLHLIGNLIYFHVFAPPLEDRLGPVAFMVYLLMFGVFGNLVHGLVSMFGLLGQAGMGVLGASGAIAGLLGFSLVRFYDARVEVGWWVFAPLGGQNRAGRSHIPVVAAAGLWLLLQVVNTLTASVSGATVSYGAHFGGFAMGVLLALGLGHLRQGRTEAARRRAERYFLDGHYHAAAGEWTEYLGQMPGDVEGRLGLARALQFSGQTGKARGLYQGLFDEYVAEGQVPAALDVYQEARRGLGGACFDPDSLARVAYYQEKQMRYAEAAAALEHLYDSYPGHLQAQRALVRLVELNRGKLQNPERARWWYDEALRTLPEGGWRKYVEGELSSPEGGRADGEPVRAGLLREPGS